MVFVIRLSIPFARHTLLTCPLPLFHRTKPTVLISNTNICQIHQTFPSLKKGTMSCASCHIILDAEAYVILDPSIEAKCNMLDLAFKPPETSRLGYQAAVIII